MQCKGATFGKKWGKTTSAIFRETTFHASFMVVGDVRRPRFTCSEDVPNHKAPFDDEPRGAQCEDRVSVLLQREAIREDLGTNKPANHSALF